MIQFLQPVRLETQTGRKDHKPHDRNGRKRKRIEQNKNAEAGGRVWCYNRVSSHTAQPLTPRGARAECAQHSAGSASNSVQQKF